MAEDDDDEGFGDFKFASSSSQSQPPNQTVHFKSNFNQINGPDLFNNEDDDWGDFVNSTTLTRTESLPNNSSAMKSPEKLGVFTDRGNGNGSSEATQPDSAPSRIESTRWVKPKGALPLSIFGEAVAEEKEEEGSGAVDPLFNGATGFLVSSKDKNFGVGFNDLLANLYKKSEFDNGSRPDFNGSKLDSGLNVSNLDAKEGNLDASGLNLDLNGLDLSRNGLNLDVKEGNLNLNGLNSIASGSNSDAKEGNLNLDWNGLNSSMNGSNMNTNGSNMDAKEGNLNLDWNGLNSSMNGSNMNTNGSNLDAKEGNLNLDWKGLNSSTNGSNLNTNGWNLDLNGGHLNRNAVDVDTKEVNVKANGIDLDWNGLNLNNNVAKLDLKELNSGSNLDGLNLDSNGNGDIDVDDDDRWEFMGAESKSGAGDEISKSDQVNTENGTKLNLNRSNLSWNVLSSDISRLNSNFDGAKSDANQLNADNANNDFGDEDGWEFKEAGASFGNGNTKVDDIGSANSERFEYSFGFGEVANGPSDLFSASNGISQKSGEWDFGFDLNPSSVSRDGINSVSFSTSQQNKIENRFNSSSVNGSVDFEEDSWAFKDAFSEIGSKDKEGPNVADASTSGAEAFTFDGQIQKNEEKVENHKGALPLSIFGNAEVKTDDPLPYQDVSTNKPASNSRDDTKSLWSNVSINDLISDLYSQAEQNASANHTQNPSENGLASTQTVMDSCLVDGDDDFDDGSWDFKGAFTGTKAEDQTSIPGFGDSQKNYSTKGELNDYLDFYSKLKDDLSFFALCYLENLKKARSNAALSGEDAKVKDLDDEIQDLHNELHQDSIISKEVHSENCTSRNICLSELVEVLKESKFQLLESEYHLSKRLSFAEKDLRSAFELLKHAASTLKILTMGTMEEQSNYVSTWFKMLSICAQELKHGALIWKQSLEKNVHCQILSKPRGKQYILALGEIYRVVEVLGSSAKLYKPWILSSSADPKGMFTLLNECSTLWSSSGLEEALQSISDPTDLEYGGNLKALLESIKYIHDLDAIALDNYVFSGQEPKCRLSILRAGTVPGMKMVVWNGEHYFLTLANLWANLVSDDPPNLPPIHVG